MTRLTQSYMTGEGTGQLLYETIGAVFDRIVDAHPDDPALVVRHQDIRWTWRELRERALSLAEGLRALGLKPGDRI